MDLRFTGAQEMFRAEARHWLAAHSPPPGSLPSLDTRDGFEAHRAWEQTMFADRWSVVSWPEQFGGRDVGILEWLIFEEEYWRIQAPARVSQNGVFLLAPTMFEFGTDEQMARFLPPMASGEEIWCQGWSEPDAGSDLAGIRSRAERSPGGDGWLLTGQKTWASRGAFAEWCFGLFRTDPRAERHQGLTYFLVELASPGVSVRPIPQIDGEPGFAEIFFENVFVPDSLVLGDVGHGWIAAMATAGSERGLGLRSPARYTETASRLISLCAECLAGDPIRSARAVRSAGEVAQAWMDAEAYRLNTYWSASRVIDGGTVGPEASANKIHWSETDLAIHRAALGLLGPEAELTSGFGSRDAGGGRGEAAGNPWLDGFLFALAGPIYAGTNEIQRNVVAERLLGLPRS
ncbi:MAG: acyl-CoA dehydrogenase family protein [Acidimicrobiales bacterium]